MHQGYQRELSHHAQRYVSGQAADSQKDIEMFLMSAQ